MSLSNEQLVSLDVLAYYSSFSFFRNDYAQSTISGWLIDYKMVINTI